MEITNDVNKKETMVVASTYPTWALVLQIVGSSILGVAGVAFYLLWWCPRHPGPD